MYIGVLKHTALGRTVPCLLCCAGEVIKGKIDASLPGTLKHFGVIAKEVHEGERRQICSSNGKSQLAVLMCFLGSALAY